MVQEEKINRRKALNRVNENITELKNMPQTIHSIYKVTFKHKNFTIFNVVRNYSIKEILYDECEGNINLYACYFKDKLNSNEHYVGILLDNSPNWIYTFYGLLKVGYAPVLLSTRLKTEEINKIIEKLDIKTVISSENKQNIIASIININDICPVNKALEENWADEIIFTTSGTEGDCKIVKYTGKELCAQIINSQEIVTKSKLITKAYKGYLKHLVILPLYHVFGLIAVFLWFSIFNVTFIFPKSLSPQDIREACILANATHIFAVPLFWKTIVNSIEQYTKVNKIEKKFKKGIQISIILQKIAPNMGLKLVNNLLFKKYYVDILGPSVKFCINGGATLPLYYFEIINGLGYPLSNGYGATEIGITSFSLGTKFKDRVNESIGLPFSNTEFKIEKSEDNIDILFVRGSSIANSVLDENRKWKLVNGEFYNTADSVIKKDQKYYLLGRRDEIIINTNGENFSLATIEKDIQVPNADSFIVLQEEDSTFSLIVSYDGRLTKFQIKNELTNLVKNNLNPLIKNIYFTYYNFPKANDIKIKRKEVTDYYKKHSDEFIPFESNSNAEYNPASDLEDDCEIFNKVQKIFIELFPENISINSDSDFYYDLSGDSMKYYQLLNRIKEEFKIEVSLSGELPRNIKDFVKMIKENLTL
ncbi:MAG: AMP-binding protein [Bacilli bacterium]|nr:AMP-binding protein [Bacilli bacterium]